MFFFFFNLPRIYYLWIRWSSYDTTMDDVLKNLPIDKFEDQLSKCPAQFRRNTDSKHGFIYKPSLMLSNMCFV